MVFGDVREIVQIIGILTRAIYVADFVFAHLATGHGIHEPHPSVRYYQNHVGQRTLSTAGHGVFEFLYGLFGGFRSPGFFHFGRTQILKFNHGSRSFFPLPIRSCLLTYEYIWNIFCYRTYRSDVFDVSVYQSGRFVSPLGDQRGRNAEQQFRRTSDDEIVVAPVASGIL